MLGKGCQKIVQASVGQGHALAIRNCDSSHRNRCPFTPGSPQTACKRFESHLDYRSRPLGRDSSRLVVKAYLDWLVRVSAACLQCSPSHTWSYNTPPPTRGVSDRVEWKGETRPGVSGLKIRGAPHARYRRTWVCPTIFLKVRIRNSFKILLRHVKFSQCLLQMMLPTISHDIVIIQSNRKFHRVVIRNKIIVCILI